LTDLDDANRISEKLVAKYGLQLSKDTVSSVIANQPNVPVLLSRASFRPDIDVRTQQRARVNRDRRNFIRGVLGFAMLSISAVVLSKIASLGSSEVQTPTSGSQSGGQAAISQSPVPASSPNSGSQARVLLANQANIPANQSISLNNATYGPIVLIHLDNGQFVAYSSICTHAGCQVQFVPSWKEIACPCHGAAYDPYNSARVLGGPAPAPLQKIPIQYDPSTGNIYLTG
jgi:thiosulfate dehydrogenase [quinone] large subunit